jgi:subtilisin family serine protease
MKRLARVAALAALVVASIAAALAVATARAASDSTYLVVYNGNAVPANAGANIQSAGGTVVSSYDAIGVVVARSSSASFVDTIRAQAGVLGASATGAFATRLNDTEATGDSGPLPGSAPAPGSDNLSGLQWDMNQIQVPAARAINGGSPSIVVGDIDTGLDYTHPDLAPNVDFADSVSCVGGVANQAPSAWADDNGHGTHTAGTIAAAKNTIGIVGVAPRVKIAGIKAGDAAGFFFPEAVVCSFMWAGTHGIDVTNNSYFADPWLFNCKNDPDQRAIWIAEKRAISFAQQNGTVVVSAEGNQSDDLAHPTQDATSPDDTTPVERRVTNACVVIPVEIPGVIGVTANGNRQLKAYYSSYGVGSADVIAPGGDRRFQVTPAAANGRVLSTWPAALAADCPASLTVVDGAARYCYLQGTSMASPHVAGVAALVLSQFSNLSDRAVESRIEQTADPMACPDTSLPMYVNFPAVDNGAPQQCQGGPGYNGFNGHGQVNALSAISK